MNNDLISREALKKALQNREECKECTDIDCIHCFYDIINNAPTVAVNCKDCDGYEAGYSAGLKDAERPQGDIFPMEIVAGKCPIEAGGNCPLKPQGEWIKCGWSIRCSICNYDMPYSVRNFCPNCGAKMKGDVE